MTTRTRHTAGFTLIEILVSVALFSIVMVVALGALLAMSEANRKAESLDSAINNLDAALDSMSRTIRTGYIFHCGVGTAGTTQDCSTIGKSYFTYLAADGSQTVYCLGARGSNQCLADSQTTCSAASPCSVFRSTDGGSSFAPLTSPEVNVNSLVFFVTGSAPGSGGDKVQPKVTILMSGSVPVSASQTTTFTIQTTVTQRIYDIY